MQYITDLEVHSKYARACSPNSDLEHHAQMADKKGIDVVGTGDFTHPTWFKEMKSKFKEVDSGVYQLKGESFKARFMLTAEVSCIYRKNDATRRIHVLLFAPSLESAAKLNKKLKAAGGKLASDGRPILGMDIKHVLEMTLEVDKNFLVIPAHCLLPDSPIHCESGMQDIDKIKIGDKVITHKGRLKQVTKVHKRPYSGKTYTVKPYYFGLGLTTTSEHPYYVIRNDKHRTKGSNYYGEGLKRDYFKDKKPEWLPASKLQKGDILLYPRFNKIQAKKEILLSSFLKKTEYIIEGVKIAARKTKANRLFNKVTIDNDFCRLVGYYLAEGYTIKQQAISFCFDDDEKEYIADVKRIMKKKFDLSVSMETRKEGHRGVEIKYYTSILAKICSQLFYKGEVKRARTKCLSHWMLLLPLEKQAEILKGWWRGDAGYTSSRELMNQMKTICLRLGIIPSIHINRKKDEYNRNKKRIDKREIIANADQYFFSNLSFFENNFNLLKEPSFKQFKAQIKRRHGWIDESYAYLPVHNIQIGDYKGQVYNLEVKNDNSYTAEFACIHNCWTPWFGFYGSKSGFDSLEEAFEDLTPYVAGIETGLSSDPPMNWRLKELDNKAIVSFSDAHSPANLGREATIFELTEANYPNIYDAIWRGYRTNMKNRNKIVSTLEFFPEEGKYHYDGHRVCNISLNPTETKKHKGICPKCKKTLTVGVLYRVQELADRKEGYVDKTRPPHKYLVPLREIIAEAYGVGKQSKRVAAEFDRLCVVGDNEFNVLLDLPEAELDNITEPLITTAIMRMRAGDLHVVPGFDGVFGKIEIFTDEDRQKSQPAKLF